MKSKIYITRKLPDYIIKKYEEKYEITMWNQAETPVPRDVLLKEVADADALFSTLSEEINDELFEVGKNLKVVSNLAVGFDNIDLKAAHKYGVPVTNTPDVLTETTADLTFALLMATARRLIEGSKCIEENKWENWAPFMLAGTDVHHKTIGIVGMGRIGEAVAKRAKGFNMNIIYHNRSRKADFEIAVEADYYDFDELIEEADFVVSLLPLTNETKEKFNKAVFKKMKNSAIFINVSRGGVVNEGDLYNALVSEEIRAAGLDVFADEPIQNDHPLVSLDNVVALPHIGSASVETREKMINLCFDNIDAVLSGKKPLTEI